MLKPRYAILVDGGFLTKKLFERQHRPATAGDVVGERERLSGIPEVADCELLRIYYYDAEPASEAVKLPVSGQDHPRPPRQERPRRAGRQPVRTAAGEVRRPSPSSRTSSPG